MTTTQRIPAGLVERVLHGVAGGLVGGLVFGVMMQVMGMIPMVAMLVGSEAVAVGWLVHLVISAGIGGSFGLLMGGRSAGPITMVGWGAGYGVVWWILGALLIMPLSLGMPAFVLSAGAWLSLVGHLGYGVLLGAVVALLRRRPAR